MAYSIKLDNDVEYAGDTCRLLEIRADAPDELQRLVLAAEAKGWEVWLRSHARGSDGRVGAVLEKGMPPRADFEGLLLLAQVEALQCEAPADDTEVAVFDEAPAP